MISQRIEDLGVVAIGGISGYFSAVFQAQRKNGEPERKAKYEFTKMLNDTQVLQHNLAMKENLMATYASKREMREWQASQPERTKAWSENLQALKEKTDEDKTASGTQGARSNLQQALQAYQATDFSPDQEDSATSYFTDLSA